MPDSIIEKHPDAQVLFDDFDFSDALPGDVNLSTELSSVTAVDSAGNKVKAVVHQVTVTAGSMTLAAILKGGINGEDYYVNFNAVGLTTAQKAVRQLEMRVRTKVTGSL